MQHLIIRFGLRIDAKAHNYLEQKSEARVKQKCSSYRYTKKLKLKKVRNGRTVIKSLSLEELEMAGNSLELEIV